MTECVVDHARRALRQAWTEAEDGPRDRRALLARATRLVGEIAGGRGQPGHLAALWSLGAELGASGASLAASLAADEDQWRAHVEARHCAAGTCFTRPGAPCQATCPAHIDIPAFIAAIGHGRPDQALAVIAADNPLPHSCGLVCPAPCESACLRGTAGQSLFIRPMKAVAAERAAPPPPPPPLPATGKRVAVVGSGPAGISAAWFLALAGHSVEMFEASPEAGGMMRYGIPAYRLPPEVLDKEIDALRGLGVVLHLGHRVDGVAELKGFDASFLAPGLQSSRRIAIDGGDLPFVLGGVDFLRAVRLGDNPRVGPKVVVVGGGNVAVDVALTALRQGAAAVSMVCLESRAEMPANPAEIAIAVEEGVDIRNSWGPVSVSPDHAITFQRCTRVFGEGRRFDPLFDPAETLVLDADQVLLAVGQVAELGLAAGSAIRVERGLIAVDRATLATGEPGVFAGGDAVHGARTVVEAVRAGKQAAAAIHAALTGAAADEAWRQPVRRAAVPPLATTAAARSLHDRPHMPECEVAERLSDYRRIELGLDDSAAAAEAGRCLRCDICIGCGLCELVCSEMGAEALRMVATPSGRLAFDDFTRPAERCLGCGACAQACPTGAIRIDDHDGIRDTVITGTVVRSQALHACPICGTPHLPAALWDSLRRRLSPATQPDRLCPTCTRASHAARMAVLGAEDV